MTETRIQKQWRNRRRMAWGAYIAGLIAYPVALIKWPELKDMAIPYYTLITFILTSYFGFATYQDIKDKEG